MPSDRTPELERRAILHAALADLARLRITDTLLAGDASPSELAAMLASTVPAVSAGTHPAEAIDPGAIAAAGRRRLPLPRLRPRHINDIRQHGDLVITVCDLAHEELAEATALHWSIPDPVPAGDQASFDAALAQLADRVTRFVPRLAAVS